MAAFAMSLPFVVTGALLAAALMAAIVRTAFDGQGGMILWGGVRIFLICSAVVSLQYVVAHLEALSNVGAKVNVQRSLQHIASGVAILALFIHLPWLMSILAGGASVFAFLILQVARMVSREVNQQFLQAFGSMLKTSERSGSQPPGAFFFLLGFVLSASLFPRRLATFGILSATFGDPLAAFGGVVFGGPRILGDKTLGGFLSCCVTGAAAGLLVIFFMTDGANLAELLGVSAVCGLASGVGELVGGRVALLDDNLTSNFGSCLLIFIVARGIPASGAVLLLA
eukprot:TRINITY_DN51403_c0_g1_i1.p2 TRINITY_DN51403_c0_g1~~TRINITY_DN51403_c0_g1_i1.p2  ORF type:complete len:284 (-),score=44.52 TRINITY_DN51403_c0_g1_i1:114-965(-)